MRSPLCLLSSKPEKLKVLSDSSQDMSSSTLISLVVFFWMHSKSSTSFNKGSSILPVRKAWEFGLIPFQTFLPVQFCKNLCSHKANLIREIIQLKNKAGKQNQESLIQITARTQTSCIAQQKKVGLGGEGMQGSAVLNKEKQSWVNGKASQLQWY